MHVHWEGVLLNHLSKKGRKPSFVAFANSPGALTPTMADWKLPTVSQLIHRIPDNLIIGSCELAQAKLQHMTEAMQCWESQRRSPPNPAVGT